MARKKGDSNEPIFGYAWETIVAVQQGQGRLSQPIDTTQPDRQSATEADRALLAEHGIEGLMTLGYYGVLDRLGVR